MTENTVIVIIASLIGCYFLCATFTPRLRPRLGKRWSMDWTFSRKGWERASSVTTKPQLSGPSCFGLAIILGSFAWISLFQEWAWEGFFIGFCLLLFGFTLLGPDRTKIGTHWRKQGGKWIKQPSKRGKK